MRLPRFVLAGIVAMSLCGSAYAAGTFALDPLGDEQIVPDSGSSSGAVLQLTSTGITPGYGDIVWTAPAGFTLGDLTTLSSLYQMTVGTFANGAPRFTLIDASGNDLNVYWGAAATPNTDPNAGSTQLNSTGNFVTNTNTVTDGDINGGVYNYGATFPSDISTYANDVIQQIVLPLDGGYGTTPGQQVWLNDITIGGTVGGVTFTDVYTATAAVPLPASLWSGAALLAGLAGWRLLKRRPALA